jgi:hypothetical protein
MPARTNAFQNLVLVLQRQLALGAVVTESKLLEDVRTGELREVDVCIEANVGSYPLRVCIECRGQARKPSVEWVEQMHAKHSDLPTDKLVLVSRSGFTGPALEKAAAYGMITLALNEAEQADWAKIAGRFDHLFMDVVKSTFDVQAVVAGDDGEAQIAPVGRGLTLREILSGSTFTVGAAVDQIVALPEVGRVLVEHMHDKDLATNTFTAEYTFPERVVACDDSGVEQQVTALRIIFDASRTQTSVPMQHGHLQDAQVTYGEAVGATGRVRVAVVEWEGEPAVVHVSEQSDGVWRDIVNVDTVSPGAEDRADA